VVLDVSYCSVVRIIATYPGLAGILTLLATKEYRTHCGTPVILSAEKSWIKKLRGCLDAFTP